jgi:NADH:ubiquinone oxidoreductase subunit 5 (subunit L)/multisubunit Na+/H+ antiporter MnhA subunit
VSEPPRRLLLEAAAKPLYAMSVAACKMFTLIFMMRLSFRRWTGKNNEPKRKQANENELLCAMTVAVVAVLLLVTRSAGVSSPVNGYEQTKTK